jgi:hypothetical protein
VVAYNIGGQTWAPFGSGEGQIRASVRSRRWLASVFAVVGISELTSVSKENRQRRESLTQGEKFF